MSSKAAAAVNALEANPIALPKPLDEAEVDEHRNLTCVHYEKCLTLAADEGWMSFSCKGCKFFMGGVDRSGGLEREAERRRQFARAHGLEG